MTVVAFIGLGIMGSPMAVNLANAGFDVVGHNRTPSKTRELTQAGGRAAGSVAEAVSDADVIITMLPDSPDVESVVYSDNGVLANAPDGSLLIDMSTIRPDVARRVHRDAAEVGIRALDAPVSGGEAGAQQGVLSIMVGGDDDAVNAADPFLAPLGKTIVHVGPPGAGQTVKAANQLIVAATIQIVSEAIVFLRAHGVDTAAAMDVLGGGLAGNRVIDLKSEAMLRNDFSPGFRIELHRKDLGIAEAAAREAGVVIPLGAAVSQLVSAVVARGDGHLDHSALLRLVESLSGTDSHD